MKNLIERARLREADAFTELMTSQMQHMYKTAYAILSNDDDAADAISDTILACWEKLGQLKEPNYFRTWMTRILVNKCYDILREKEHLLTEDEMPAVPVQDEQYERAEWKEAIARMDEKYRVVMLLYYVEGFRTAEISELLEIPESTVRTRLARGREKLAREYFADGEGVSCR